MELEASVDAEELERLLQKPKGKKVVFRREYIVDPIAPEGTEQQVWNQMVEGQWQALVRDILALANGNIKTTNKTGWLIIGADEAVNADGEREIYDTSHIHLYEGQILEKVNQYSDPPLYDVDLEKVEIDEPNIMIGSATGLGFMDFLVNLGPVVIVITIVTLVILKFVYFKSLSTTEERKKSIFALNEHLAIKDKKLLIKSLAVLAVTVLGFMFHQSFGYESATIALFGGATLLLISKLDPEDILLEIEWPTIFFFISLFILVGALEDVGVIHFLAEKMLHLTRGDIFLTAMLILWGSAIASAFLDNIPFVATMIPLIASIGQMSSMSITPLWWALALGACLGGNGTLVGASANVIASGMLEKQGFKLSFVEYMKVGFPVMLVSVAISTVYLIVRYL